MFQTHRFTELNFGNLSVLLTIEYYPPPWNNILASPRASDFTNVEVPVRVPLPIGPHWGQFLKWYLVYPLSRLPKLRDLRGDLGVNLDAFTDKWVGPVLHESGVSLTFRGKVRH